MNTANGEFQGVGMSVAGVQDPAIRNALNSITENIRFLLSKQAEPQFPVEIIDGENTKVLKIAPRKFQINASGGGGGGSSNSGDINVISEELQSEMTKVRVVTSVLITFDDYKLSYTVKGRDILCFTAGDEVTIVDDETILETTTCAEL
jgi:hypothetical protein